tara:strand:- start:83 stop:1138 length:1056 start_codon:yes stop_codon:yes gene_type:complete
MLTHKITKISAIEQSQLSEFYKKIYFNRHKSLINNWRWWYRHGYSKYEPLIILSNEKVIGQAGIQPVDLKINNEKFSGVWFLDFAILPEFRGKGFGKILTKKLMEACPHIITFCNKKTLSMVKNFGWKQNTNDKSSLVDLSISRLAKPINPLKFIPILNKFDLKFIDTAFRKKSRKKLFPLDLDKPIIQPKKIEVNYNVISESFKKIKVINIKNQPEILRDEQWLYWRVMECPYKKDLYFFEYKNNFAIVHIFSNKGIKRLNILFSYFVDEEHYSGLFSLIMSWSIDNKIDFVWAIKRVTTEVEHCFENRFKKPLIYASWSSDKNIFEILKNGPTNVEGIDSDIDSSLFIE